MSLKHTQSLSTAIARGWLLGAPTPRDGLTGDHSPSQVAQGHPLLLPGGGIGT